MKQKQKDKLEIIKHNAMRISSFLEGLSYINKEEYNKIESYSHIASNISCWVNEIFDLDKKEKK